MSQTVTRRSVPVNGSAPALLDQRPIVLPGFTLRALSAEPTGTPTLAEWTHVMSFAEATEEASPYWIGDLELYADTRPDWAERLSQATAHLRLAKHTRENLKSVSRRVGLTARRLAQSKSHSAEVAALEPADQEQWLERSRSEGWTERELREALRAAGRGRVLDGRAEVMHTVDVTVQCEVEAHTAFAAEAAAWSRVKDALHAQHVTAVKVIAAHTRPR